MEILTCIIFGAIGSALVLWVVYVIYVIYVTGYNEGLWEGKYGSEKKYK